MSELLDNQVNVQKESLKKTSGVHASSHKPTKKCAMKMKEKKTTATSKIFFVEGRIYRIGGNFRGMKFSQISRVK